MNFIAPGPAFAQRGGMNLTSSEIAAFPGISANPPHLREAVRHDGANGETARGATDIGATLVTRAQAGDREALEALLTDARPRALAVAAKVLRSPDDAEDAVQDAF